MEQAKQRSFDSTSNFNLDADSSLNPFPSSSRWPLRIEWNDETALKLFGENLRYLSTEEREFLLRPSHQLRNNTVLHLQNLWLGSPPKYNEVRARLYDEWFALNNNPLLRKKLETFHSLLKISLLGEDNASLKSRFAWIDYVEDRLKEHGSTAQEYFEWARKVYGWIHELVEEPDKFGGAIKPAVFKTSLEKADWRVANDESAIVSSMLLYGSTKDHSLRPHFLLGSTIEGLRLGLRLNGRALAVGDTSNSTLERYKARELNPKIFLGLRFDPIDSPLSEDGAKKTIKKRSLLFVPLGNILSDKSKGEDEKEEERKEQGDDDDGHASYELGEGKWGDTGFVLLLEIRKDGRPGHFYVVCNLTYRDMYDRPQVLNITRRSSDDELFKFCGKSPPFTVAEVNDGGQSSLSSPASSFLVLLTERSPPFKEIQLKPMSRSAPEIAETGMNGLSLWRQGGDPPVALYPK